jgi:ActR/RegA family two-component response regulator
MERPATVLVVDDDDAVREVCHDALLERGCHVVEAATGSAAIAEIRPGRFDAAVVDLRLEDLDGMDVVAALRAADPETCILIMTGYADLDSAVEAVKHGVYDYLRKPFDAEDMARAVERGLERRRLAAENARLLRELQDAARRLMAHKRRLEEKIEVATEELSALIDLGKQMAATADTSRLLALILARACALTGAGGGHILEAAAEDTLIPRASQGDYALQEPTGTAREALRLAYEAVASARPTLENELHGEGASGALPRGHPASVLVVPIVMRGRVTGALTLYDKACGPFTSGDADLMTVLAVQAAGVLSGQQAAAPGETRAPTDAFIAMEDLFESP